MNTNTADAEIRMSALKLVSRSCTNHVADRANLVQPRKRLPVCLVRLAAARTLSIRSGQGAVLRRLPVETGAETIFEIPVRVLWKQHHSPASWGSAMLE